MPEAVSETDRLGILIEAQNKTRAIMQEVQNDIAKISSGAKDTGSQITQTGIKAGIMGGLISSAALVGFQAIQKVKDEVIAMAKGIFDSGVNIEQTRVAFETMLGSASLAEKTLSDLTKFALKTPFNLPELQEASKRLLAYGVQAQELIPVLTDLGNITAGVGREKLNQLILAFGQVRAATYLTGMELRQFTEAGVPLLEELGKVTGKTAAQIKDDMESGMRIPFSQVREALGNMSGEGGRFFNLMEKQSHTIGGLIANLSDTFGILGRAIAGIDTEGNFKPGGLMEDAKNMLENLYDAIQPNITAIIDFGDAIIDVVRAALTPFIGKLADIDAVTLSQRLEQWTKSIERFAQYVSFGANSINALWNALQTGFQVLYSGAILFKDFGLVIYNVFKDAINAINPFHDVLSGLGDAMKALVTGNFGGIKEALGSVSFGFGDFSASTSAASNFLSDFNNEANNVTNSAFNTQDSIDAWADSVIALQNGVQDSILIQQKQNDTLSGGGAGAGDSYVDAAQKAKDKTNELEKAHQAAIRRANQFIDSFVNLKEKMKDAIKTFTDFESEGKKALRKGIADEIVSAQTKVKDLQADLEDLVSKGNIDINVQFNETLTKISSDLNSSIIDAIIGAQDKLDELQKQQIDTATKQIESTTSTLIKSQVTMNRLTGEITNSSQTTTSQTEYSQSSSSADASTTAADLQTEIDTQKAFLAKYADYVTSLSSEIASARAENADPILAAQNEADAQIAAAESVRDAAKLALADQAADLQAEIDTEQAFLTKHEKWIENHHKAIRNARIRANRDAIDTMQADFAAQAKAARKELKSELQQIKKDTKTLIADLSDEYTKIPDAIGTAMEKLAKRLEKGGLIAGKGNSVTNNKNITINVPASEKGGSNMEGVVLLLSLI